MPQRSEINYFGAGPAPLPTEALEDAAKALLNYQDTGLGIAEHSHRSKFADQILANTKASLTKLLSIPENYEILFLQGGGTGEFAAVVYNLVRAWVERRAKDGSINHEQIAKEISEGQLKCDYIVTGSWSAKAAKEAEKLLGKDKVNVVIDARKHNDGKFGIIPDEDLWKFSEDSAFIYYCDNETVDGVEFPGFPTVLDIADLDESGGAAETTDIEVDDGEDNDDDVPMGDDASAAGSTSLPDKPIVVADMSSNILSRKIDVSKFGVIFAGAQKNIGVTGVTIAIVRKDLFPPSNPLVGADDLRKLGLPVPPTIFDWSILAANNSLYNTLSIFDVWIAGRVMSGILARFSGDLAGQEALANQKATLFYEALERQPEKYRIVPDKSVRSRMNICFRILPGEEEEKKWIADAEKLGLTGLKGHRSVGGIRISNYNAISLEAAQKLVKYIDGQS